MATLLINFSGTPAENITEAPVAPRLWFVFFAIPALIHMTNLARTFLPIGTAANQALALSTISGFNGRGLSLLKEVKFSDRLSKLAKVKIE